MLLKNSKSLLFINCMYQVTKFIISLATEQRKLRTFLSSNHLEFKVILTRPSWHKVRKRIGSSKFQFVHGHRVWCSCWKAGFFCRRRLRSQYHPPGGMAIVSLVWILWQVKLCMKTTPEESHLVNHDVKTHWVVHHSNYLFIY